MKKFLRFVILAAIVVGVVWATRDRMLPKPQPPDHHPPPFRHPPERRDTAAPATEPEPAPPPRPQSEDDLQQVKGIGPVYAGKLRDLGITTFAALIAADSATVADKLDVSVESIVDWKTQATAFIG